MRFLHTSDWHIGLGAKHAGSAASRLREERFAAARRIAALAREAAAEFVIIAGDLFDSHTPAPADLRATAAVLQSFPVPVFVLPGNHDPDVPGGPWDHSVWADASNVRLLRQSEPLTLSGGVLFPCPLRSRWHTAPPLEWIPPRRAGDGIRLGVAHGGLDTFGGPIPGDAAVRYDLDYLALGDWHSVSAGLQSGARQAYSGTPEPDSFNQRDSGYVLLVDIPAPQAEPVIELRRTGRLEWISRSVTLEREGDARRLREQTEQQAGEHILLHLEVKGLLHPGEERELDALTGILAERFYQGRLTRGRLLPAGLEDIAPDGFPALAEQRLQSRAAAGDETAARALLLLRRLAWEVRS